MQKDKKKTKKTNKAKKETGKKNGNS